MSSESAAATIAAYTFRQLETPAGGSVRDVADVLSAAHAEAEQIREAARAAGEAAGRAAGLAAAQVEMRPALQALAAAAGELHAARQQVIAELESDAVTLAIRVAEHIVTGTIDADPQRIVGVAGLALRRIIDRRTVTLVVNPADLEVLSQSVAALQSELGGIERCNVQSDRRVGRGGVLARTEDGEIDASIDTQLHRVHELVAAELRGLDPAERGAPGDAEPGLSGDAKPDLLGDAEPGLSGDAEPGAPGDGHALEAFDGSGDDGQ